MLWGEKELEIALEERPAQAVTGKQGCLKIHPRGATARLAIASRSRKLASDA